MSLALAPLPDLTTLVGFGVAGNFAGHLQQAGEAADFVRVAADGSGQAADGVAEPPKGIFPWFVPGAGAAVDVPGFLGTFPVSHDEIVLPEGAGDGDGLNLQIEPEVGVIVRLERDPSTGAVVALVPVAFGAFNDCSIRREGAKKISHKKNWGPASKGLSRQLFALENLEGDGPTATWRLACFLRREGAVHAYGIDSALPDYSYYGSTLLDWIVDRLAAQLGSDDTPLEHVGAYVDAARLPDGSRPTHALIGIGATRYTEVGESTFLRTGDESIVIVYDGAVHTPATITAAVDAGTELDLPSASVLRQRVTAA